MQQSFKGNPLRLGGYFADPEPRQWADGRMYLYCSHDRFPDSWCCDDYHVLSSDNLVDWTDHGIAFHASNLPPNSPQILYACDCVFRGDTYYLFFTTPEGKVMAASSPSPVGPFQDARAIEGIAKGIDPAVFVDDDGEAFIYWGQFDDVRAARLNAAMTGVVPNSVVQPLSVAEHNFHEGSALIKRNSCYYYVYADTGRHDGKPTCLAYATGPTPLGPFTYRGVIIDSCGCDPGVWNNHGRITQFNDDWYVFYHRSTHGSPYLRQTCCEPIAFNTDGSIPEVPMTSQGPCGPIDSRSKIPAASCCRLIGNARVSESHDGLVLSNISNDDSAAYRFIDFSAAPVQFTMELSGDAKGAQVELRLRRADGEIVSICAIPVLDGAGRTVVASDISKCHGVQEIWLNFKMDTGTLTLKSFSMI